MLPRNPCKGSVLVLALIVVTVLMLFGLALAWFSHHERWIGHNHALAVQASYRAEATLHQVKGWFDDPRPRPQRGPPPEFVGAESNLLQPPYAVALSHPVRVTDRSYLTRLEQSLFGDGLAQIEAIEISAPPQVRSAAGWRSRGVASVRAVVRVRGVGGRFSQRWASAVVHELPLRSPAGPFGPLHSCSDVAFGHDEPGGTVRWGGLFATGRVDLGGSLFDYPEGLPRSLVSQSPWGSVWGAPFATALANYQQEVRDTPIRDPWVQIIAGAPIMGLPAAAQPSPSPWQSWRPGGAAPTAPFDRSHLAQFRRVGCPVLDYTSWKDIATSGMRGVRYFRWVEGSRFVEPPSPIARDFADWTRDAVGVFFFDTRDSRKPDQQGSNLTPPLRVANWNFRGLLYVNAESFQIRDNVGARQHSLRPPGEPFHDRDQDGKLDPDESWIDLSYPTNVDGVFVMGRGLGGHQTRGPWPVRAPIAFAGILFCGGAFEAQGRARLYGTVIAQRGVTQPAGRAHGAPQLFWDASLLGEWPGPDSSVPRVLLADWAR